MTPLQTLTDRIRELVPELMELSFGCRMKKLDDNTPNSNIYRIVSMSFLSKGENKKQRLLMEVVELNGICPLTFKIDVPSKETIQKIYETIGHPITLEHCRVALRRGVKDDHPNFQGWGIMDQVLCESWEDLQPFESQTEVHALLEKYLLTNN